jgi:thiamine pyrophosphate-dependent enzyme
MTRPRPKSSTRSCERKTLCSTLAAESSWQTRRKSWEAFVNHLSIPVAHSLMGKGVLPDDHPMTLGMTGFWGTKVHQQQVQGSRLRPRARNAVLGGGLQLMGPTIHIQFPAEPTDPYRYRPKRNRPQLSCRDRSRRRPQASAEGARRRGKKAPARGTQE